MGLALVALCLIAVYVASQRPAAHGRARAQAARRAELPARRAPRSLLDEAAAARGARRPARALRALYVACCVALDRGRLIEFETVEDQRPVPPRHAAGRRCATALRPSRASSTARCTASRDRERGGLRGVPRAGRANPRGRRARRGGPRALGYKALLAASALCLLATSAFVCQRVAERGRFASAYSSYGSGPKGARALYLLGERLGARPAALVAGPRGAAEGRMLVALGDCESGMARPLSRYEEQELARWVEEGGVLLVAGVRHYLPEGLAGALRARAAVRGRGLGRRPSPTEPEQEPEAEPERGARRASRADGRAGREPEAEAEPEFERGRIGVQTPSLVLDQPGRGSAARARARADAPSGRFVIDDAERAA